MKSTKQIAKLPCDETPNNCNFGLKQLKPGEVLCDMDKEMNYIIFCQRGKIQLTSSLFQEETLQEGEMMFLPRMADCQGEIPEDTHIVIHSFNNTVCRPENCILSYLYTHRKKKDDDKRFTYCCKLPIHDVIVTFIQSICHYLIDNTGDLLLWHLKHKELIRLLSRYYKMEELQSFFHPMTDEEVPFKSLVLSHYMKANDTQELADLCGYGVVTFRRIFKEEFGMSVYQWLIKNVQNTFFTVCHFPISLSMTSWRSSTLPLPNNSTASVRPISATARPTCEKSTNPLNGFRFAQ